MRFYESAICSKTPRLLSILIDDIIDILFVVAASPTRTLFNECTGRRCYVPPAIATAHRASNTIADCTYCRNYLSFLCVTVDQNSVKNYGLEFIRLNECIEDRKSVYTDMDDVDNECNSMLRRRRHTAGDLWIWMSGLAVVCVCSAFWLASGEAISFAQQKKKKVKLFLLEVYAWHRFNEWASDLTFIWKFWALFFSSRDFLRVTFNNGTIFEQSKNVLLSHSQLFCTFFFCHFYFYAIISSYTLICHV